MSLLTGKRKTGAEGTKPAPEKRGKMARRVVGLTLAVAVLGGAGFGVKALFFTGEERIALTGMTSYGSLSTAMEGTGVTMPADSFSVTAASSEGKITGVYVTAGETVTAGQLLYTQDDSELDDELDEYQKQVDDLYDQIDNYNDQIDNYTQQISDLRETMAQLTVTAPFAGRVTEVQPQVGDQLQKGTRLATLVDDSQMTLTQYFSYAYEDEIFLGMTAGISVPSLMNTFSGTVTEIKKVERLTTEGTRCFAVTITLDNPGALTQGMTGAAWLLNDGGEKFYPAVEGSLEYKNSKAITARAAGELLEIQVDNYETVKAGQSLFTIDGSDYTQQIENAEKGIENARKSIATAQDRIASYTQRMAETEERRGDYNVTSDIDGKVIMVSVREGETPRSGMTAVSVYNLDNMEITANIDELDISNIQMGMEVRIVKSGTDGSTFTGYVSEISYEATNSNGVAYFPITITIPAEGKLSAGVNVSYYISLGDDEEGVLAPLEALKSYDEGACLYVKADQWPENALDLEEGLVPQGFYAVPVEVGAVNSRYARILSGVEQDVEVFTRYQQAAPTGGDTTSRGEDEGVNFPGDSFGGGFPGGGFSGGNGGMPSFSGGGGMPGGMGGRP
ncbi:MAG: HlyD family efflux transporter periplasmic adaptor subunit [Oscillospiraceae bacterium]|nr:HlyD family efflux transporter periplasmic adaptor subunit [Oscillospiraceae bacterium]